MKKIRGCVFTLIIACVIIPAYSFGATEPDIYADVDFDAQQCDDTIELFWDGSDYVDALYNYEKDVDAEAGCCLLIQLQYKMPGKDNYITLATLDYFNDYDLYIYEPSIAGKYSFRIRAKYNTWVEDDDYEEGGYVSDYEYSDWTYASAAYTTLEAPILSAKTAGETSIKLSWNKVNGAEGYKLYRSTSKGGTYKLVKTINSRNTITWTNKSLTSGKKYYYYIIAFAGDQKVESSKKSAYAGVKKPAISSIKISGTDNLKIKWAKVDGASGYEIYRKTSSNGKYKKIKTIKSGSTLSYLDRGTTEKKKYYYKIKAYRYIGGNKIKSRCSAVKSRYVSPNEFVGSIDYNFYDEDYGDIVIQIRKLKYVNGNLQMKAFVQYADEYTHVNSFNWIRFTLKSDKDNTVFAKQKFYDKNVNLDGYDYKFMTFTFDEGTKKHINLRDIGVIYDWQASYSYGV